MRLHLLSPGDPAQRTGGYRYNARLGAALRARGHTLTVHALPGAWPLPGPCTPRDQQLAALPDGALVLADGLCWAGLGAAGAALARRCRVVVLLHSPLHAETGLGADRAARLQRAEAAALRLPLAARVATSALTAAAWPGLPVAVVQPGCDPAPRSRGGDGGALLAVGTLTPRKGHLRLVQALAGIAHRPWHLALAGSEQRDPACAAAVRRAVATAGLSARLTFLGECDDAGLERAYDRADLLVHAAHFEGYGMAIAEALRRGVAVVCTPAGIVPTLPPGAVTTVPTGAPAALGAAITAALDPPGALAAARAGAATAGAALPGWDAVARQMERVLVAAAG